MSHSQNPEISKRLRWSVRQMRDSAGVLVDRVPDPRLAAAIAERLERRGARLTDLHLWRVGPGHNAAVMSLSDTAPQTPQHYKTALSGLHGLSHVTVEVTPPDRGVTLAPSSGP